VDLHELAGLHGQRLAVVTLEDHVADGGCQHVAVGQTQLKTFNHGNTLFGYGHARHGTPAHGTSTAFAWFARTMLHDTGQYPCLKPARIKTIMVRLVGYAARVRPSRARAPMFRFVRATWRVVFSRHGVCNVRVAG